MDAGRSAERAGQMRQGSLPSQYPQHTAAQTGRVDRDTETGTQIHTPAGAARSGGRGQLCLGGRVPAPDIFSGRERVSRQPENAEPRHPMEVFSQLAPKTACSLVQWPAQHAQLEQRASHAAVR